MKIAFCCAEDINLGAGYVMAHLKGQGHEVKLFFNPLQFQRGYARKPYLARLLNIENSLLQQIKKYKPDICCFSCVTATYKWGLQFAERIKRETNCKIIFGGVHATLVPEEVKRHKFIDEIVIGDGIEYFGGKFEPDKLWPDRESFFKVLPPLHRKVQLFMTGFGCPLNCSFCGNEQLRKIKQFKMIQRSISGCLKELEYLKKGGMRYVLFVDDILLHNTYFLRNFMLEYKKRIGLPFICFGHAKYVNKEVVGNLKDGGCHSIWLGIQTGDERLRKQILNRPETNQEIIDACKIVKEHKIKLIIDHIFGIPGEIGASQDVSYNLYEHIEPDIVNCYELLYFPKAKIIEHALLAGVLMPSDVEKINRGEGIVYQVGNTGQKFYNEYAKALVAIPLGGVGAELMPMWLIKLIAYLRAGRGFIPAVMIQNEVYFTCKRFVTW